MGDSEGLGGQGGRGKNRKVKKIKIGKNELEIQKGLSKLSQDPVSHPRSLKKNVGVPIYSPRGGVYYGRFLNVFLSFRRA